MEPSFPFHQCPHCLTSWDGLAEFVSDLNLRVDGYIASCKTEEAPSESPPRRLAWLDTASIWAGGSR